MVILPVVGEASSGTMVAAKHEAAMFGVCPEK